MQLIYLDESGNSGTNLHDPSQPVFVLGALMIPEEKWKDLVSDMEHVLVPLAKEFGHKFEVHAHEIASGRNHFRDIGLKDRLGLIHELLDLVSRHELSFVYRSITKKRFARWVDEQYGKAVSINPHVAAFPFLAKTVHDLLREQGPDALGILICDDNREVHLDIEKSLRLLQQDPGDLRLNQIIEKGFFIDSSKSAPLQLVDVCVYYARKREERIIGQKPRPIDDIAILKVEALTRLQASSHTDIFEWLKKQNSPS